MYQINTLFRVNNDEVKEPMNYLCKEVQNEEIYGQEFWNIYSCEYVKTEVENLDDIIKNIIDKHMRDSTFADGNIEKLDIY